VKVSENFQAKIRERFRDFSGKIRERFRGNSSGITHK